MDNLGQFRTRVRRYLRESDGDVSYWSDAFLNQLFNAAYRRRCSQLIMAHEGYFTLIATRDLEEGKSTYGFPSGTQRCLKVELVRSDGTRFPLERDEKIEVGVPPTTSSGAGDSYVPSYRPISNGFILEPTPQQTVTNGIRLEYSGVPVYLSNDSDTPHLAFPEILDEILVLDTVMAALEAERMHELGPGLAIQTMRGEWEIDWTRFVERRIIARERTTPQQGPWLDY